MNRIMATPRVSTDVLAWVTRELVTATVATIKANQHEQATNYDIDATIERKECEAVESALEYVQKYLAGEVD